MEYVIYLIGDGKVVLSKILFGKFSLNILKKNLNRISKYFYFIKSFHLYFPKKIFFFLNNTFFG